MIYSETDYNSYLYGGIASFRITPSGESACDLTAKLKKDQVAR
jgi:hypothetical protein